MSLVNILVMYIHIGAGIFWIGSLLYVRFILLPGLGNTPPDVRGPVIAEVGPRTIRIILRVAEVTIAAGIINVFLMGRITRMADFYTTTWGLSIFAGLVGALAIYILGQTVTRPITFKIAETVRAVGTGQGPADAPVLLAALAERQRNVLTVQVIIGVVVVLGMAIARFS